MSVLSELATWIRSGGDHTWIRKYGRDHPPPSLLCNLVFCLKWLRGFAVEEIKIEREIISEVEVEGEGPPLHIHVAV